MPCYKPITGWRSRNVNASGKRPIVFSPSEGYKDLEVTLPCGRCIGCRIDHSRQWAVRCMHERQMSESSSFITLTYSNDNLPENQSITKPELQRFFKRLRKNTGIKLRYFACGEYGDKTHRPHYHAIIFGTDFPDKTLHTITKSGHRLYRSAVLETSWKLGHSLIGDVTFESAAYVARYVMKKRKGDPDAIDPSTGKTNAEYYMIADPDTGEVFNVEPEFCLMSKKPGLGNSWLQKYKSDTNKDFFTLNGNKFKLPKYYDSILEKEDELSMLYRRKNRKSKIDKEEQTYERLTTKEKVKYAQLKLLPRNLTD